MRDSYIAGVGMTSFGRFLDRGIKELSAEAIRDALRDAAVAQPDVQAVFFGNAIAGLITGQECIRGQTVTHAMGFDTVPVTNVENACASGGSALHLAWSAVAGGQYDTVLAVGCEKMVTEERAQAFQALMGAMDLDFKDVAVGAGTARSPFVDRYARVAELLMARGVTPDAFANVAAKAHANGSLNPRAQRQRRLSPAEILASRAVLHPLTLLMCSPISDGAAAAVVTSRPGDRHVKILASQLRSLPARVDGPSDAHEHSAAAAYEQAGIGPHDVDFAELHDATSPGEMISWVESGLCRAGDEQQWAMTGHTTLDGPMPVNPSGGLVARGHPVGATGVAQAFEAVTQLRGEAGERQLERARTALIQCGGGLVRQATAASSAHILAA